MTNLTNQYPNSTYGDLLTTTNNGQGLTTTLEPLQDGLGNNSTVTIATNAINFNRSSGNTFQLDGVALTASAQNLNIAGGTNAFIPLVATGTLSAAQILSLNTNPVTVINAPGVGFAIVVSSYTLNYIYGGIQYQSGGSIKLSYSSLGKPSVFSDSVPPNLSSDSGNVVYTQYPSASTLFSSGFYANESVVFTNDTTNYTTGNGTANYSIIYQILPIAGP